MGIFIFLVFIFCIWNVNCLGSRERSVYFWFCSTTSKVKSSAFLVEMTSFLVCFLYSLTKQPPALAIGPLKPLLLWIGIDPPSLRSECTKVSHFSLWQHCSFALISSIVVPDHIIAHCFAKHTFFQQIKCLYLIARYPCVVLRDLCHRVSVVISICDWVFSHEHNSGRWEYLCWLDSPQHKAITQLHLQTYCSHSLHILCRLGKCLIWGTLCMHFIRRAWWSNPPPDTLI